MMKQSWQTTTLCTVGCLCVTALAITGKVDGDAALYAIPAIIALGLGKRLGDVLVTRKTT